MTKIERVLVVEDNQDIRELIRDLLQLEGYDVLEAENGAEALQLLNNSSEPCVILSDLVMPVMDGFEFVRRKNKDDRLASLPLIVLSAIADGVHEKRREEFGSARFLSKPVNCETLIRAVDESCSQPVQRHLSLISQNI